MRENFKILKAPLLRDPRTERRIIELNRERFIYILLVTGAILVLFGIVW